jgi:hypothetical protein
MSKTRTAILEVLADGSVHDIETMTEQSVQEDPRDSVKSSEYERFLTEALDLVDEGEIEYVSSVMPSFRLK